MTYFGRSYLTWTHAAVTAAIIFAVEDILSVSAEEVDAEVGDEASCRELDPTSTYTCPTFRYCPFNHFTFSTQIFLSRRLNYNTMRRWNEFRNPLEKRRFDDLSGPMQRNLIKAGYTAETHDCCNNHFNSFSWDDLLAPEYSDVMAALDTLEFTREKWDAESGGMALYEDMYWGELSEESQYAAHKLCHTRETWDGISLSMWTKENIILPGQIFLPPTSYPTSSPTVSAQPTMSASPTKSPTNLPTKSPTSTPTTSEPTDSPTRKPTKEPTNSPTLSPTSTPTTSFPTESPSKSPTKAPTNSPTQSPTSTPTTSFPTDSPTKSPTKAPTNSPTKYPSSYPTTSFPTELPSKLPTKVPTSSLTLSPVTTTLASIQSHTEPPTKILAITSTETPTKSPTKARTDLPTKAPIKPPITLSTEMPTKAPTVLSTKSPTVSSSEPITIKTPSKSPSTAPTESPTKAQTNAPTKTPTDHPTKPPTKEPTQLPTNAPTKSPTKSPTDPPTKAPTNAPIDPPTTLPSKSSTEILTKAPKQSPTKLPTALPTEAPTPYTMPPVIATGTVPECRVLEPDFEYYCPVERYCPWSSYPRSITTDFLGATVGYTQFGWDYFLTSPLEQMYWSGLSEATRQGLRGFNYDEDKFDCCNLHYWEYGWEEMTGYYEDYEPVLKAFQMLGYTEEIWNSGGSVEYSDYWWNELPLDVREAVYDGLCYTEETWNGFPMVMWASDIDLPGSYNTTLYS